MAQSRSPKWAWTEQETQFLIDNFSTMSTQELADAIGCGRNSVKTRIAVLRKQGVVLEQSPERIQRTLARRSNILASYWSGEDEERRAAILQAQRDSKAKLVSHLQLNYEQDQMVLGSLMGNMSLARNINSNYQSLPFLTIVHKADNADYVDWKYRMLLNLTSLPPRYEGPTTKTIQSEPHIHSSGIWKFITRSLPCFEPYYARLRPNDAPRKITREWVNRIDPDARPALALATWYMDNGYLSTRYNATGEPRTRGIGISLGDRSADEVKVLTNWLFDVYDLELRPSTTTKTRTGTPATSLGLYRREAVERFIELVEPYVLQVPSMMWKIDLQY